MIGDVLSPDCFFDLPEPHETKIKTEATKTIIFFIDIDFLRLKVSPSFS
jgi:hypothetical protein